MRRTLTFSAIAVVLTGGACAWTAAHQSAKPVVPRFVVPHEATVPSDMQAAIAETAIYSIPSEAFAGTTADIRLTYCNGSEAIGTVLYRAHNVSPATFRAVKDASGGWAIVHHYIWPTPDSPLEP